MEQVIQPSEAVTTAEAPKKKYSYHDNSKPGQPEVFACEGTDIIEADKAFEKAIGYHPAGKGEIGCSLEKVIVE